VKNSRRASWLRPTSDIPVLARPATAALEPVKSESSPSTIDAISALPARRSRA